MEGTAVFFFFFFPLTNNEWYWGRDTDWAAILVQRTLEEILLNDPSFGWVGPDAIIKCSDFFIYFLIFLQFLSYEMLNTSTRT